MNAYSVMLFLSLTMATGEHKSVAREAPSLEECFAEAQFELALIEREFEHRDEMRIGVGCYLVKNAKDS